MPLHPSVYVKAVSDNDRVAVPTSTGGTANTNVAGDPTVAERPAPPGVDGTTIAKSTDSALVSVTVTRAVPVASVITDDPAATS